MVILCIVYSFLLIVCQIIYDLYYGKFDIFRFRYFFQLYYFIQLPLMNCMYGLMDMPFKDLRMLYPVDEALRYEVSVMIMIGHTFLALGLMIGSKLKICKLQPNTHFWNQKRTRIIIILGVFLQILSFIYIVNIYGGVSGFLGNLSEWRYDGGARGKGIFLFWIQSFPALVSCLMVYYLQDKYNTKKFRIVYILYFLFSITLILIMGYRGQAFYFFIVWLMSYHFLYKKVQMKTVITLFMGALGSIFLIGLIRGCIEAGAPIDQIFTHIDDVQTLLIYSPLFRIEGSEIFARVIVMTDEYRWGWESIYEAMTIMIPGSIWDKPEPTFFAFSREVYGLEGGGITPTILANLYWEFGMIGITMGMFVIGIMLEISYNNLKKITCAPNGAFFYAYTYNFYIILAASINGALNFAMSNLFMYFFFVYYLREEEVRRQ